MRVGAALAAARAYDANAGRAMQAPSPRKKRRREKLSCRSAARLRVISWLMSVGHRGGCLGSHLLEWRGLDDARQQCRETTLVGIEFMHDFVDRFHVVILRTATGGVGEHPVGQRAVEILSVAVGEDLLELAHAPEGFPGDQLARRQDGLPALR